MNDYITLAILDQLFLEKSLLSVVFKGMKKKFSHKILLYSKKLYLSIFYIS